MSEQEDFADWKNQSNSVNPWLAWQARADLAAEQIERLEAEREEAAHLLRMVEPLVDNFTVTSEPLESIREWLARIDAQRKKEITE